MLDSELDSREGLGSFLRNYERGNIFFRDSGDDAISSVVMWASALGFPPALPVFVR
jgi:hypothetical protein